MYKTSTNILKKEENSTYNNNIYNFIYLGTYNSEREFYRKANAILRKEEYKGPKFERTFLFEIKKEA